MKSISVFCQLQCVGGYLVAMEPVLYSVHVNHYRPESRHILMKWSLILHLAQCGSRVWFKCVLCNVEVRALRALLDNLYTPD